jgi:hypothetical protein
MKNQNQDEDEGIPWEVFIPGIVLAWILIIVMHIINYGGL